MDLVEQTKVQVINTESAGGPKKTQNLTLIMKSRNTPEMQSKYAFSVPIWIVRSQIKPQIGNRNTIGQMQTNNIVSEYRATDRSEAINSIPNRQPKLVMPTTQLSRQAAKDGLDPRVDSF